MHYPLLVNAQAEQPTLQQYSIRTVLCYTCIILTTTTFTFYDLILAYSTSLCYTDDIPTQPLPIHLWLYISGYLCFALSVFSIICYSHERTVCQERIVIVTYILVLMNIIWNIMGNNILWFHYSDYVKCSVEMVIYMGIRLIIGIIINILQLYMHYRR